MPTVASAADYYKHKWFDYPDAATAPKVESRCAHWASGSSFQFSGFKCHHTTWKVCTNPTHVTVVLLRRDVVFIVSGPASPTDAVQKAVAGYAAGCAAVAITSAEAAAAGTSETLVGELPAAAAALPAAFQACIVGVSVTGIVAGIVNQLNIHIDTSGSHWSPV
jgi:hypothetical protein